MPSAEVSSCKPPESVTTNRALLHNFKQSVYPNGATCRICSGNEIENSCKRACVRGCKGKIKGKPVTDVITDRKWLEETFDADQNLVSTLLSQPAYYLVNARVGFRLLDDALELGVTGFNITNNRHRQHPRGQQLEARVVASATYRF